MKGKLLIFVGLFYFLQGYSQNLLTNPGFEAGGNGVGFGVSAAYNQMAATTQATSTPGDFGILQYPKRLNSNDFYFVGDRTTGNGRMLVVDGTTAAGTPVFWAAGNNGNGITTAVIGTTYYFSYWIRSVSDLVVDPATQAEISVALTGGNLLTQIHGSVFAPLPEEGWKQVIYSFVATATTVEIELSNLNVNATGNDFAVDDFVLTDDLIVAVDVTNAQCVTPNDGAITVSAGFGGIPPYNYAIAGPVNDNNTTGFFTSLPPGVYTVTVTDSALPTATVQTLNNVIVGPYLYTTMDTTICFESSTVLEVGGSSSTYTWTSAPVDSSLTTPNNDTITVSPDETTIYTVTSVVGNCAPLVKNVLVTVDAVLLVTNTTTPCSDVPINLTDSSITAGSSAGTLSYWTNAAGTTPLANPSAANVSGTYYIKLTQGSCVTIKPITITVQPTSTFPADFTICPGNTGTINLTGTPFSTVTIINDLGNTYTANIGPAGTGSFITPPLQETRIYTLVSVKNFFTLCERFYTGVSVTLTVVPNGCATVETVPAPGTKPLDLTLCTAGECRTLEADISPIPSTTNYSVTSIPYCPRVFPDPSAGFTPINVPNADDQWSETVPLPFEFCFYGQNYNQCWIGTNGLISFDTQTQGDFCDWPDTNVGINNGNTGFNQKNAIFGVFQDTDFRTPLASPADRSVSYKIEGSYPCRKLIVNFYHLGQWSCNQSVGLQTSQIILYEISNIIEVFVERRVPCSAWNGTGLIGIINQSGSQAVPAPGRDGDDFQWSAFNEAWRFTPTGPNVPVTIKWFEGTTQIGTGPVITVCPTVTTTYTLNAEYTICNSVQTATNNITLEVNPDLTGAPLDITECEDILTPGSAVFDLTSNNSEILGTLDPNEYEITYHLNFADADALTNSISNPSAFVSSGQTIYAAIFLNMFGCIVVKEFDLIVDNCGVDPDTPPDLTECEDSYNTNIATFDFTPQLPLILGSNNAADYTITFHLSLADANIGAGDISPINSFLGTNGQEIFIRMEDNADPTRFGTTSFFLNVNPLPTVAISGTTTVCEGDNATITFTGTPNALVDFNENGGVTQTIDLGATGIFSITSSFNVDTTFTLINVTNPTTNCSQLISGSATVTVRDLPTATISGSTTVCEGDTNPVITFTGADGIAPYTFTYTDPTGATQTIQTISGNSVTLPVSTATPGTFDYQLTEVLSSGTPACSQLQTGSVTVVVNALPDATITGNSTVCLNDPQPQVVLTGSSAQAPYTFTYSINSVVQPTVTSTGDSFVINAPTNVQGTFVYDLISVSESSTPACSQPITGSITITVNTAPVITTPTAFVVCDDSLNNDGIYCFDLTQKDLEVSTDPNVVITYHETSTDAQIGANAITGLYCNLIPNLQDIFVRASFTGSTACYSTTQFQLIINSLPLPNPVITDYELCDYNGSGDEEEVFVLNTKTAEIANGQTGVTVTYYASQADAQNQVNSLPNNYTNTSNPQQIWINIRDTTTGCNTVGSFNLVVNPLPLTAVPLPIFQCSNGTVTTATFDLTVNENITTAGATGMIVSYYNTLVDAQTPSNVIPTPLAYLGSDNETVYVRVENSATGCYSVATQLLRVTQGPVAITPTPLERCDPNNDGFEVFDLTLATNQIAGGSVPPGVTVTYHETPTDALLGSNPILGLYPNIEPNQQTIYVKVFYTTTGCSNYVQLELIVNPTPEATEPTDYHLCDYTGAVGYESFDLTSKIAEILGSINAATHTVTFYTDLTQAQLGTGNITNVTAYINGTIDQETLYIRVETNATGCYDIVTLDLIVDPLPNSTQPSYAQYSLCDYDQSKIGYEIFDLSSKEADILLGQTGMSVTFYPSLTDAQNDTNAITNLNYENAIIYVQTLGIRITNDATGCYVVSTMDIRVEPLPEPIPPTTPYTICDDNQDGFANFILSTLEADILGGEVYIITFHETLTNAQQGTNALSTTAYTNINPFVQILYVRAEDPVTGCFSVMPITLEVNPSPIAPIDLDDIEVCDTNANNQNGQMTVDLTIRTADVLAQQPLPASSYTVTYYTSQPLAEDGDFPIINTSNYLASNLETIWVRVENNATGCYNLGSFQVFVGIPLVVPTPQPINECDTLPNDQFAVFDLTVRQITALPGYTFQYYPSWTDAQNDTNQITNITSYTNVSPAVQTLGVRIISAQGCVGYTTLNIRVLPAPEPNTNPNVLPAVCEGATTPGQALVDLTQNEAYILNGDPNLTVEYYPTLADLENNTNQIINPASALVGDATLVDDPINLVQYVYIAVSGNNTIDYTGRKCYTVVPQGYVINPLPKVDIIGTSNVYQICESDPTGNDNIEVFDLTSQIPDLLEGNVTTPISTYSVAFYETATGSPITNPSAYTNTSNPQTIYVVITNTNAAATTMCPSLVGSFTLQVNPKPVFAIDITNDLNYETCDENDGINDGQTLHNGLPLSDYIDDILGTTQSPTDYTVTFHYNSQSDAEAGLNAIQDLATYQVQTGTYWVRIENNLTGCYITDSFAVIVEQLAEPNIVATTNIACVNFGETTVNNTLILDSQVTGNYTFEWYADGNLIPSENGPTLTVTEVTDAQVEFSVIAISNSALQCASDTTPDRTRFTVIRSGLASNLTYTVTNAFSDLQIITVSYDGYGVYHFSLDDGPILDNGGVFTNVPIGTHTVHVWDVRDPNGYSCGEVSIEGVQIIDYPHYFTPNGDGYHETWNIKGLENFADATKIYIFDRHGKLLKQISSDGDGWDGTYNGQLMPSTDYWFKVEYPEAGVMKEFKAHFSLKR